MNKVGIIVHPFWCIKSQDEMLDIYSKSKEEFDKLIVFLPLVKRRYKVNFVKMFGNEMVDILFRTKDYNKENTPEEEQVSLTVNSEKYMVRVYLWRLAKVRKQLNNTYNTKFSIEGLKNKLKEDVLYYFKVTSPDIFNNFLYGDMSSITRVKKHIKKLKYNLKGKDVKYLYYGGTEFINTMLCAHGLSGSLDKYLNKENDNYIFGEYYNKCVEAVAWSIKTNMEIETNVIKNKSVYLAENVDQVLSVEEQKEFGYYLTAIDERLFVW